MLFVDVIDLPTLLMLLLFLLLMRNDLNLLINPVIDLVS